MNDEPTRIIRRGGATRPARDPEETELIDRGDKTTVSASGAETIMGTPDDNRTILHRRPAPAPGPAASAGETAPDKAMEDPVVGWLVVVAGPGRGNAVRLGYGQNQLGRDRTNRATLPFGDGEISRTGHAIVTYDPRQRKFYLSPGTNSINLTYVGNEPVLMPRELTGGERIQFGQTTVAFTPFCGPAFDWADAEKSEP